MKSTQQVHSCVPLREYASLPQLTPEQERALITRALADEDVRDQIILSLQRRVYALAEKYARPEEQEEFSDLVNSANVALLKYYQRALHSLNPYAYLLRVARSSMIDYYRGYGEHTQRERIPMLSLDRTRCKDGLSLANLLSSEQIVTSPSVSSDATYRLLRLAIASLPEKQRLVIERHYGFEQVPQSLNMLKGDCASRYHHKKALSTLKEQLTPLLPQLANEEEESE